MQGAEKALIQAALRVRFPRGKGFIPFPSKSAFLLRNKTMVIIQGSIEVRLLYDGFFSFAVVRQI